MTRTATRKPTTCSSGPRRACCRCDRQRGCAPVVGSDHSSSIDLITGLFSGAMPGVPRLYFAVVDVRDAADLHLKAMTHPRAAGERFIAAAGDAVSLHRIARAIRDRLGDAASTVPATELPDETVRTAAEADPALRVLLPNLGTVRHVDNDKARTVLGWNPRSSDDAVAATAESLLELGLLPVPHPAWAKAGSAHADRLRRS